MEYAEAKKDFLYVTRIGAGSTVHPAPFAQRHEHSSHRVLQKIKAHWRVGVEHTTEICSFGTYSIEATDEITILLEN